MAGDWRHIVGESRYQAAIASVDGGRLARGEEVHFNALLIPNSSNPHDPNTVAVYADGIGVVGHLSREDALTFRPHAQELDRKEAVGLVRARLIGGWGRDENDGRVIPPGVMIALDVDNPDPADYALAEKLRAERAAAAELARDPLSAVPDWASRRGVALWRQDAPARVVALAGESTHQVALAKLHAALVERKGTMAFRAIVVPVPGVLVAVAVEGYGLVGRFPKADADRYGDVLELLARAGLVGVCHALIHDERGGFGVKVELLPTAEALAAVTATTARGSTT